MVNGCDVEGVVVLRFGGWWWWLGVVCFVVVYEGEKECSCEDELCYLCFCMWGLSRLCRVLLKMLMEKMMIVR